MLDGWPAHTGVLINRMSDSTIWLRIWGYWSPSPISAATPGAMSKSTHGTDEHATPASSRVANRCSAISELLDAAGLGVRLHTGANARSGVCEEGSSAITGFYPRVAATNRGSLTVEVDHQRPVVRNRHQI